ncbi:MAG: glycosyltransferase family 2 protein [bacterium]|nr:glycosyltransferase family 2 protein [bacterium]
MLTVLSIILQVICAPIGIYYLLIGLAGFLPLKNKHEIKSERKNRFALIAAAHNEETVIANLIRSLKNQNYPKDCFDVFVTADNCTDRTAEIARSEGAVVYERKNDKKRGKGFALEWFFEKLFSMDRQYDYIAVFDADNLVSPDFLTNMNESANRGHKVVQGFLDSKNPYDSWISAAYSFCFWTVNRVFQLARYKLGLCCELSGTGFIIKTELLKKLGWGATCLTEDMEFTMKAVYNGEKIAFNYDARVYDEKPLTLRQSWRQRVRWMRGHCDVASRYFFKLIGRGITKRSWSCIDCAVYLVQPIRIIAMGIIMFFSYAQSFHPSGELGFIRLSYLFGNPAIWNVITVLQLCYMPFVVIYERKEFRWKTAPYFLLYSIYNLTWVPIAIQGLIGYKKTDWSHTVHSKNITLEDIQKISEKT